MIKLFKLAHCAQIPVIGYYPQIEIDWPWDVDYRGERSYIQTPLSGPVRQDIVFPRFKLAKLAKANDWVGDGGGVGRKYWMISTRLYDLIQTFSIDEYQYFPAPVHTLNGVVDYHLIYFLWPRGDDFINWERSVFRRTLPSGNNQSEQFANTKERQFAKDEHELQIVDLVLNTEKITVDIFHFKGFETGFYVSERLKNAMEADGMTGIEYEIPEWLPK